MLLPNYLAKGDKVGIVAPAKSIEQDAYPEIIKIIEREGFIPVRGKSTFLMHGPFAGQDKERAEDLQLMIDDPEIKAIFCLRGGYGTIRIIEQLSFKTLEEYPKWIIGFSDITIIHNALSNLGIMSIHGQMPLNFLNRDVNKGLDKLFNTLTGEELKYTLPDNDFNRCGSVSSELIGGNVAILCSLIGTPYDIDTDGKILFIEEVGEYLYRFDRLMHHLKLSGKLENLAGLIVGGLTDMKDNEPCFGQTSFEIVRDLVEQYEYPIAFGFPAGHIKENYPLIYGKKAKLDVHSSKVELTYKSS